MQAKEVMTQPFDSIQSRATIAEAARKMKELNVGVLPVLRDGSVVGIVTDRDLVLRVLAEDCNPEETAVEEIMTSNVWTCYETANIQECARIMEGHGVRRLVVTDIAGKPKGIMSIGDIATKGEKDIAEEVLSSVSASPPQH